VTLGGHRSHLEPSSAFAAKRSSGVGAGARLQSRHRDRQQWSHGCVESTRPATRSRGCSHAVASAPPRQVLHELFASASGDQDHVLLYCLDRPPKGVLPTAERLFGSRVDHWLYIADPRDHELDDLGDRATVVRWDLGAFPYETRHLDTDALIAALNAAVRSLSPTHARRRVGLAIADCSAVMRWVQNADTEVALEKAWHNHVREAWSKHLGTEPPIDVCIYYHDDMRALGLTIDQVATALTLVREHPRVFVLDQGEAISGSPAISRILRRAQPAGISTSAWRDLTTAKRSQPDIS
jgi:hypothetical protein